MPYFRSGCAVRGDIFSILPEIVKWCAIYDNWWVVADVMGGCLRVSKVGCFCLVLFNNINNI